RNKLGNRNAIRNASRFLPAPNRPAKIISRTRPRMRLERTARPTTPVARVLIRRSSSAAMSADSNHECTRIDTNTLETTDCPDDTDVWLKSARASCVASGKRTRSRGGFGGLAETALFCPRIDANEDEYINKPRMRFRLVERYCLGEGVV